MEARLRSELSSLRGERNEALGTASSFKRKAATMEGDLQATKQRLVRIEQEKIKMERDNRAAISLAKSVGSETSSDVDFYKRKVRVSSNVKFLFRLFISIFLGRRASEPTLGTASGCRGAEDSDSRPASTARAIHESEPACKYARRGGQHGT